MTWIVAFLGNDGARYSGTRHNTGFMVADAFEEKHGVRIKRVKFHALTAQCAVGEAKVFLMKPTTYMNGSGTAVSEAMGFYKTPLERVLVVSDDVSLPVGRLRVRRSGSAGGHNGLKDIIARCGGDGFPRVRVGVGAPPDPDYDLADWVLSTFKGDDVGAMRAAAIRAVGAIETVIVSGVDAAMNEYNRSAG